MYDDMCACEYFDYTVYFILLLCIYDNILLFECPVRNIFWVSGI